MSYRSNRVKSSCSQIMTNSSDIQLTFDGEHQVCLKFGFLRREISISWTKKLKSCNAAPVPKFQYCKNWYLKIVLSSVRKYDMLESSLKKSALSALLKETEIISSIPFTHRSAGKITKENLPWFHAFSAWYFVTEIILTQRINLESHWDIDRSKNVSVHCWEEGYIDLYIPYNQKIFLYIP